jgi:hypothetical protein
MPAMRHSLIIGIVMLCGCAGQTGPRASTPAAMRRPATTRPAELAQTEFAMVPGQTITARTPPGTIRISADDWLRRSYTWEGATRSVEMWPRDERWYGSLGIYYPGPGRHWEEHRGITRGVVQEGQQHFTSEQEALAWIRSQSGWKPHVYTRHGLVVGWRKVPEREQLDVDVWQIMVNGRKPPDLPGATDAAIQVSPP